MTLPKKIGRRVRGHARSSQRSRFPASQAPLAPAKRGSTEIYPRRLAGLHHRRDGGGQQTAASANAAAVLADCAALAEQLQRPPARRCWRPSRAHRGALATDDDAPARHSARARPLTPTPARNHGRVSNRSAYARLSRQRKLAAARAYWRLLEVNRRALLARAPRCSREAKHLHEDKPIPEQNKLTARPLASSLRRPDAPGQRPRLRVRARARTAARRA